MDRNQNCFNKDVIMTKITIFKKAGKISGYLIKGHSGYAEEGSDIVCSGISAVSQMALVGLTEVLKKDVDCVMKDGLLSVDIKGNLDDCQVLLNSMELSLKDIAKNYSAYVKFEIKGE